MKFVIKNANAAKCRKNVKCGHFCSNARGKAKLMINFFGLIYDINLTGRFLPSNRVRTYQIKVFFIKIK